MNAAQQMPGCLPEGFTLDSMLTPDQFCIWQQTTRSWFSKRVGLKRRALPGVVVESREHVRIHPRTYLSNRTK